VNREARYPSWQQIMLLLGDFQSIHAAPTCPLGYAVPNNIVYSLCVKSSDTNLAESLQRISGVSIDADIETDIFVGCQYDIDPSI